MGCAMEVNLRFFMKIGPLAKGVHTENGSRVKLITLFGDIVADDGAHEMATVCKINLHALEDNPWRTWSAW